ncbi:hypothetical protein BCR34DRAFT_343105 [Clohesyomyces aquaticus]|uniref:Uncharacterized protein n=1 Tax=Clohesyomyces aquaticus TaxID=1231657 RepID=A0A1Y2A7D9_9PLEO|nr:hypothetical protein BCR34DRAFT_343105 [Clohesyomyces aquaticus]
MAPLDKHRQRHLPVINQEYHMGCSRFPGADIFNQRSLVPLCPLIDCAHFRSSGFTAMPLTLPQLSTPFTNQPSVSAPTTTTITPSARPQTFSSSLYHIRQPYPSHTRTSVPRGAYPKPDVSPTHPHRLASYPPNPAVSYYLTQKLTFPALWAWKRTPSPMNLAHHITSR